jgi:hypothetical protein
VNVGLFAAHKIVSEYAESIKRSWRICGKNLCIYGEDAKRLLACSPSTPKDRILSIFRIVMVQHEIFLDPYFLHKMGWIEKPFHATVPLAIF